MISETDFLQEFENQGMVVVRNALAQHDLSALKRESLQAIKRDQEDGVNRGSYFYLAHNRGEHLLNLMLKSPLQSFIDLVLGSTCILHSYNGVVLFPNSDKQIQHNIHRDSQRFCRPYLLSAQILYMLDDFTVENGATYFYKTSHLVQGKPSEQEFNQNATQVTGKAGDAVIFDSMLWHSAGINRTDVPRIGLTKVFTRAFMKQQIDLCRATPKDVIENMNATQRRIIGFDSRVPSSLQEFCLPPEQRMYKPNQG